jgi:hypothetical protein
MIDRAPHPLDVAHPHFVEYLERSDEHVHKVADWLRSLGRVVEVKPLRVRPTAYERVEYFDEGDLLVNGNTVEVKQRDLDFERPEDWPWPTLIIDSAAKFDRKQPPPVAYLVTNRTITCCFIVDTRRRSEWVRRRRIDGRTGLPEDFYECAVHEAIFRRMDR